MSRRRSTGRLTREPAHWVTRETTPAAHEAVIEELHPEQRIPWWYAEPMPHPWENYLWHQWPSAWADITLRVCNVAWRKYGAKYYDAHRDATLRDDLRDWLVVKAVEAAASFQPKPWHPAPSRNYGAYLRAHLDECAPQHFAQVVGRAGLGPGEAARLAHRTGIDSTDRIADLMLETGQYIGIHPLHADSFGYANPESVIIRLESLLDQVADIEDTDVRAGRWTTASTAPGNTCLHVGCDKPSIARGLCRNHYNQQRRKDAPNCSTPDCTQPVVARGLCPTHWKAARETAIADGTWTAYGHTGGTCEHPGCNEPLHGNGLCQPHYNERKRTQAQPCTEPDCDRPRTGHHGRCRDHRAADLGKICIVRDCSQGALAKGLCGAHYARLAKGGSLDLGDAS